MRTGLGLARSGFHLTVSGFGLVQFFLRFLEIEHRGLSAGYGLFDFDLVLAGIRLGLIRPGFGLERDSGYFSSVILLGLPRRRYGFFQFAPDPVNFDLVILLNSPSLRSDSLDFSLGLGPDLCGFGCKSPLDLIGPLFGQSSLRGFLL